MNKSLFKKDIAETGNHIFEVVGLRQGDYDNQAVKYDKLISNGLYNRIMWGNSTADYSSFCREGLQSNPGGVIADIGCGTLGFTYKEYAAHNGNELYLCDLSLEMLKIGKSRIEKISGNLQNKTFLRSDALDMPFKESSVQTVLNFGLFHIFDKPEKLVSEIVRILKPGGQLFLTSLCNDRKLSAKYLKLLHKKGHVAKILSSAEIKNIMEESGIKITGFRVKGGMIYISGIKNTNT